tara:strand:+ start:3185 stop:3889 length:705 start_codon:yes stop_codon:yes gene_type:complete
MKEIQMNLDESRLNSLNNLKDNRNRSQINISFKNKLINKIFISSFFYRIILILFGFKIGKGIKFNGPINFILNGPIQNIELSEQITFGKNITIKIRENGKIILKNKVYIDDNVRLVAARDGHIEINEGTEIGANSILNSGGEMNIGRYCLISNNCNINSSNHSTILSKFIMDQNHEHGKTIIKDDVWIGGFVTITYNTIIEEGAVIGANSLVLDNIEPFTVNVGAPTKKIRNRE